MYDWFEFVTKGGVFNNGRKENSLLNMFLIRVSIALESTRLLCHFGRFTVDFTVVISVLLEVQLKKKTLTLSYMSFIIV